MKILKKVAPLFCVSLLALPVLTSCSGTSQSPKEALEAAMTNTSNLSDRQFKAGVALEMAYDDEKMDITFDVDGLSKKVEGSDYPDLQLAAAIAVTDYSSSANSEAISADINLTGGNLYLDMMDRKMQFSMAELQQYFESQMGISMASEILSGTDSTTSSGEDLESMIKDVTVSQTDGKSVYDVTFDTEKLQAYADQMAEEIMSELGVSAADASFEWNVKSMVTSITVENDYVTIIDFTLDTDVVATDGSDSETINVQLKMNMENIDPGESVQITFPDFTEYQEIPLSSLTNSYVA